MASQQLIDSDKLTIAKLQDENKTLLIAIENLSTSNKILNEYLVTPSHRIRRTNYYVDQIMKNFHNFPILADLMTRDDLTAHSIQEKLFPLISQWSYATEFSDFLPHAAEPISGTHCRPIFTFGNAVDTIKLPPPPGIKNTSRVNQLIGKFSSNMMNDIQMYKSLQLHKVHDSLLHMYIGYILSCYFFALTQENKIEYPADSPVVHDYNAKDLNQIMSVNPEDIASGPEAAPVVKKDLINLKAQNQKRAKN